MLIASLLVPPKPYSWTTDPTVLGWIAVISLIITVLSIFIGLGGGYWFYRKSRNWHQIIYEVISDTPIVSVQEQTGRGKIKVTYEALGGHEQEINDARLLTLKVWNTGNGDAIIWSSEDKVKAGLEIPIEFEFEGRTVVGLTHLETNPSKEVIQQDDFEAYLNSPSPTSTHLSLPRCILKQDQSIQLGILLNGPSGGIKRKEGKILNGEIVNFRDLEQRSNIRSVTYLSILMFIFLATIFLLGISAPPYYLWAFVGTISMVLFTGYTIAKLLRFLIIFNSIYNIKRKIRGFAGKLVQK